MMGIAGQSMMMAGVYMGALTQGKSQAEAFGITWALGGLLVTKFAFTEAEGLGAPKTGPLVWAALSAGIAYAASSELLPRVAAAAVRPLPASLSTCSKLLLRKK